MDEFNEYCIEDNDVREDWVGENFYWDGWRGIGVGVKTEPTGVGGINQVPKEERLKRRGTTKSGWHFEERNNYDRDWPKDQYEWTEWTNLTNIALGTMMARKNG